MASSFLTWRRLFLMCAVSAAGCGQAMAAPTLAEAFDQPGWTFTSSQPAVWTGLDGPSHDGTDAVGVSDGAAGALSTVSTVVNGPGTVRFFWKMTTPEGRRAVSFSVTPEQGSTVWTSELRGWSEWARVEAPVPAGRHTLSWQYRLDDTDAVTGGVWLDELSFDGPGATVSLGDALEATDLPWSATGAAAWVGTRLLPAPTTADAAMLDWPAAGGGATVQTATLSTAVTGPGMLRFVGKGTSSAGGGLVARVGNGAGVTVAGNAWAEYMLTVPAGAQTVTWTLSKPESARAVFWLDGVRFLAGAVSALDVALDTTPALVTWNASGSGARASFSADDAHDGVDAVKLDSSTWVDAHISGPARVSAWVRQVAGEATVEVEPVGGGSLPVTFSSLPSEAWGQVSLVLPAGEHSIRWRATSPGAALDEVNVTPLNTVPLDVAADSTGVVWTSPQGRWSGLDDALWAIDGTDVLRAGPMTLSAELTAAFTGAGVVDGAWLQTGGLLTLSVDSTPSLALPSLGPWERLHVEVGAGAHSLRWLFEPGGPAALAQIDSVGWQPGAAPSHAGALDTTHMPWVATSAAGWSSGPADGAEGNVALLSPVLAPGEEAVLATWVPGPATLSFRAREFSAQLNKPLRVDTQLTGQGSSTFPASADLTGIGGEWRDFSFVVPAQGRQVRWTVTAGSEGAPAGALQLDRFAVQAGADPRSVTRTVDGPFQLSFRWTGVNTGVAARVSVDGEPRGEYASSGMVTKGWRDMVLTERRPGPHTVRWTWYVDGADRLADVVFTPRNAAGSLAEALELTDVDVTIDGTAAWGPHATLGASRDGVDAARLVPGDSRCWIWLNGPSTIHWSWRNDREYASIVPYSSYFGNLSPLVDEAMSATHGWFDMTLPLHASLGETAVLIVPPAATPLAVYAWLDRIEQTPGPPALGANFGMEAGNWTAAPAGAWGNVNFGGMATALPFPVATEEPLPNVTGSVNGPGMLRVTGTAGLGVTVDGVSRVMGSSSDQWWPLSAGSHAVTFTAVAGVQSEVRSVTVHEEVPVSEACDVAGLPGFTFTSVPAGMKGFRSPLARKGDSFALTPPLESGPVTVTATVQGPARLLYAVYGVEGPGTCQIRVDAVAATPFGVSTSSSGRDLTVPAGNHTVEWLLSSTPGTNSRLALDAIQLQSLEVAPAPALTQALDLPGQNWTTSAAVPFTEVPHATAVGGTAAASEWVSPLGGAWVETTVNGPGMMAFQVEVEQVGTSVAEPAEVLIGEARVPITLTRRQPVWVRVNDTGPVVVRFSLPAKGDGMRRLVLDDFRFVPDGVLPISLGEAVDAPTLAFQAPGVAPVWRPFQVGSGGASALAHGPLPNSTRSLQTKLPAAGTVQFKWQLHPYSNGINTSLGSASFRTSNGSLASRFATDDGAVPVSFFILPAEVNVSWRLANAAATTSMLVDEVQWTPAPLTPSGEALDAPGLTWTTGGDAAWVGLAVAEQASDGVDSLVSPLLGDSQSAWFETTVPGPFTITFDWRLNADPNDLLTFAVDGVTRATCQFSAWVQQEFTLNTAGPHTLRWKYAKDGTLSASKDTAWVDKVNITTFGGVTLPTALDSPAMAFTTGGSADAIVTAANGGAAGGSAAYFTGGDGWIETSVTGPGVLSFAWLRLSGDSSPLTASVDGVTQLAFNFGAELPLRDGWRRGALRIPAGAHVVRWRRQATGTATKLMAGLDDVAFESESPVSSLNEPGVTWSTHADGDWAVSASGALVHRALGTGATAWVEALVSGPGTLRCTHDGEVSGGNVASISVDGTERPFGDRGLTQSIYVPEGAHRIRWTRTRSGTGTPGSGWLEDISWTTGVAVHASALGAADIPWLSWGDFTAEASLDAPLSPNVPFLRWRGNAVGEKVLEAVLARPAQVAVRSRYASVSQTPTQFTFSNDTNATWLPRISIGSQVPGFFRFVLNTTLGKSVDLAGFLILTSPVPTLADGLDTSLPVTGTGGARVVTEPSATYDGSDAVALADGETAGVESVEVSLTGPGTLSFRWMSSLWIGGGLTVDGIATGYVPTGAWQAVSISLPAGAHLVAWTAESAGVSLGDLMTLDQVTFEPAGGGSRHLLPSTAAEAIILSETDRWSLGGDGVLRTELDAGGDASPLRVIVPGRRHLGFSVRGTPVGVPFSPVVSALPGLAHRLPSASTEATHSRWLLDAGATMFDVGGNGDPQPVAPYTSHLEVRDLAVLPLVPVPLADALESPVAVTSPAVGGWQGVRAGTHGDDVAIARVETAPTVQFSLPGAGHVSVTASLRAGSARLSSGATILDASSGNSFLALEAPLTGPGPHPLAVSAQGGTGWALLDRLTFAASQPPVGFAEWAQSFGLAGGNGAEEADADGDGASNLLEYVAGTNPSVKDAVSSLVLTPSVVTEPGGVYPELTWTVVPRPDVTYVVETWDTADQAATWTPESAFVFSDVLADGRVVHRASADWPLAATRLWRLKIVRGSP